jgi:hypothetical protein
VKEDLDSLEVNKKITNVEKKQSIRPVITEEIIEKWKNKVMHECPTH